MKIIIPFVLLSLTPSFAFAGWYCHSPCIAVNSTSYQLIILPEAKATSTQDPGSVMTMMREDCEAKGKSYNLVGIAVKRVEWSAEKDIQESQFVVDQYSSSDESTTSQNRDVWIRKLKPKKMKGYSSNENTVTTRSTQTDQEHQQYHWTKNAAKLSVNLIPADLSACVWSSEITIDRIPYQGTLPIED